MNCLSVILAIGMAAAVSAQTQCASLAAAVPTCGQPCITSAASVAGCVSTDYACQCSSSAASVISNLAATCVLSNCGIQTGLQVESSAYAVCSCVSSIPSASTTPTTSHSTSVSTTTKSAHPTSSSSASPGSTVLSSPAAVTSAPTNSGSAASPGSTVPSSPAAVTSAPTTSGYAASSGAGSSPVDSASIFQSSVILGGPVANATAPMFTGGQDMLRPVMSLCMALFALFGGLIILL